MSEYEHAVKLAHLAGLSEPMRVSTELLHRTMISNSIITSALEVPRVFPDLKRRLFHGHLIGASPLQEVLSKLTGKDIPMDETFTKVAESIAEQTTVNAEAVISAAVIVLSHSNTDEVFTKACSIAIDLAPNSWKNALNVDAKVSLKDVLEKGGEGVLNDELNKLKQRLGKKSLPSRAGLLFSRVPIKLHKDIGKEDSSYYRESSLKAADDLRHDIVHRGKLQSLTIAKGAAVASLLNEAAATALRSLSWAFNIPLDFERLRGLVGVKTEI